MLLHVLVLVGYEMPLLVLVAIDVLAYGGAIVDVGDIALARDIWCHVDAAGVRGHIAATGGGGASGAYACNGASRRSAVTADACRHMVATSGASNDVDGNALAVASVDWRPSVHVDGGGGQRVVGGGCVAAIGTIATTSAGSRLRAVFWWAEGCIW
jgi:hypothetical protein